MNLPRTFLLALLVTGIAAAQEPPAPAPAAEAPAAQPQSEMQKWIATTDEGWQAVFKRDVTDLHLTALEKLKQHYVAALDAAVTKASSAGDLDGALALREEEKRFAGTNLLPEQDEATDGATVKQIRAAVRALIAKLEKDTAARTKALHAKYDQVLADAQSRLTQAQRLDDALLVKKQREQVAAAWVTPLAGGGVVFTPPAAQPNTPPPKSPQTAPAQVPPAPAMDPKIPADIAKVLVGTWRWSWVDHTWSAHRTFRADGTFTAIDPGKPDLIGHWEIGDDKITLNHPNGTKEQLILPLRANGTKGIGARNREMKAEKGK